MFLSCIRFGARDLAAMPEKERVFAVLLGHISNEINILQKLILMAHDLVDDPDDVEVQGRNAQTTFLLRVLVGKLNEAHRTIEKHYIDAGLHEDVKSDLSDDILQSLTSFIEHFSKPANNINVLRKKISVHNDWEFARKNLRSVPNDAGLFIYTDETAGNTLFQFADLGVAFMMSNHVQPGNFAAGLGEITDEAVKLARWLLEFSSPCLAVMIRRRIEFKIDQVELRSAPKLGDVRIPFFMVPVRAPATSEDASIPGRRNHPQEEGT